MRYVASKWGVDASFTMRLKVHAAACVDPLGVNRAFKLASIGKPDPRIRGSQCASDLRVWANPDDVIVQDIDGHVTRLP